MNRTLVFFLFILTCIPYARPLYAQDTLHINLAAPLAETDIRSHIGVLVDASYNIEPQFILNHPFKQQANIFHTHKKQIHQRKYYWFKIIIHNTSHSNGPLLFFTGWHDKMNWYQQLPNQQIQLLGKAGMMVDKGGVDRWDRFAFPIYLKAGETKTYYLQIQNTFYRENPMMPVLYDRLHYEQYRNVVSAEYACDAVVFNFMLGMLFVLLCITVINYTQLPDNSSLYYAVFLLGLVVLFAFRIEFKPYQLSFFHRWPMLKYYGDVPALLFCFYLMYLLFGMKFLGLRERWPAMEKTFKYFSYLIGALVVVSICAIYFEQFEVVAKIFTYTYFGVLFPLTIVLIALAKRVKHHPLVRFFLYGSIWPYLVSLICFFKSFSEVGVVALPELAPQPLFLTVGVLLQMLFFAAGLSYRHKVIHLEKTKTQEMLIRQLNKNKALQRKLNEQLEELVKEQTTEILRRKQELEEQRKLQLDIEYGKKVSEIELKAIRAQINPHFIFNCLNSIQLFVMQRDYEYAQKYLSDFSYLIRKTLDFSRRNFITLSDEITYLNTYLGLEKMRFENKMDFSIIIDQQINAAELEVPAMLLQPYVENAVKHGMTNEYHQPGQLNIHFNMVAPDMLECIIEDNGIGIQRTKALRTMHTGHQSSGMEISLNRAELLNKMYNTDIQIEIIDKSAQSHPMSGTVVRILIPQL
ncbi:7TMR-DISM extracellular protein 2 [Chitinophaga skermanii]|uniref:7TMR-DISM extracellular protein 2 n=1 Tax=Chitinophaga skermanii TaxID=331697 RepID=A0A327R1A5_9BACT|nr:histidine kinase [Chitinophaga skermanii]RAJ10430.1 7TMR-DISM extracellular protein 2 [Chitinophaga skermanii]